MATELVDNVENEMDAEPLPPRCGLFAHAHGWFGRVPHTHSATSTWRIAWQRKIER
jgi:hypothetical protein